MASIPPFTFQELVLERAKDPATADKPMVTFEAVQVTYAEYARRSIAWGHLFAARRREPGRPVRVAVMMRNCIEFLDAYGGSAFAGGTIFGINTGLGGDTLATVLDRAGADVILVDETHRAAVEEIAPRLGAANRDGILCVGAGGSLERELGALRARLGAAIEEPPDAGDVNAGSPWVVIYTSGTTGVPKGIVNSHGKLRGVAIFTSGVTLMRPDDVGYISMPLFHSNALFLNWLPAFTVGARVVLREKFTASGFVEDVFRYGATYWNYVGQPVHYVLEAISKAHGGDEAKILANVAGDPRNKMRMAVGTGASGAERARFTRWLGMQHVYENYGSTEAEISTWCMPGDPIDSVGEVKDPLIAVVNEQDQECSPLEVDDAGNPKNYAEAVGEIVRRGVIGLFQGYYELPDATKNKVRNGLYRSGDLGAVRVHGDKRCLYFIGRTDDWIRKDGENFSGDNVAELATSFPGVDRAAAYGVPHPVSDEWVMIAVRMKEGERFDPRAFFDHCEALVAAGRDRKWFPDFVRVVDDFEWTETVKIKVRMLKGVFYHPAHADRVYFRRRGDTGFSPFGAAEFASLRGEFEGTGRASLLHPKV